MIEPLIVIVHGNREHALRMLLADHIVVEHFANLARRRDAVARLHQRGLVLLADDVHAELDALVADEHGRTGDELAHLMLALSAERTVARVLGVAAANLAHSSLRSRLMRTAPHTLQTAALTIRSGDRLNCPNQYTDI